MPLQKSTKLVFLCDNVVLNAYLATKGDKTMKKILLIFALLISSSAAYAEESEPCVTVIERASNPILEIITIPFKVVAAFSHLPRCMIQNFPVEEK